MGANPLGQDVVRVAGCRHAMRLLFAVRVQERFDDLTPHELQQQALRIPAHGQAREIKIRMSLLACPAEAHSWTRGSPSARLRYGGAAFACIHERRLASPPASWNQIVTWLKRIEAVRQAA